MLILMEVDNMETYICALWLFKHCNIEHAGNNLDLDLRGYVSVF
jgi:hypothetical protein